MKVKNGIIKNNLSLWRKAVEFINRNPVIISIYVGSATILRKEKENKKQSQYMTIIGEVTIDKK